MTEHDTVNGELLRNAFAQWASGVAIVTALDTDHRPIGVTVNSLVSVSLQPPLLLWSIGQHAPEYQAFCNCTSFAVHILDSTQQDLSNRFADPSCDKFAGLDWQSERCSLPCLPAVPVRMVCVLEQTHAAGDHCLLIGRVQTLAINDQPNDVLVYWNGDYRRLS